jgi:hypothetical protein
MVQEIMQSIPTRSVSITKRKRLDGRSKQAKRIAALITSYGEHLADIFGIEIDHDPAMKATVLRLAELECLCEIQRAKALRGEPCDLVQLTRTEGLARRLRKSIGLDSPPV